MGRAPCCDKTKVKRGPWSPEEDNILKNYIHQYGTGGNWILFPQKAGLKRCGKSCRLRWLNYLRPNIKHGGFTEHEDNIILTLYHSIGSRWSIIASHLPERTDNDVKNHWNTKLKKKLLSAATPTNTNHLINFAPSSNVYVHNNNILPYFPMDVINSDMRPQISLPDLIEIPKNEENSAFSFGRFSYQDDVKPSFSLDDNANASASTSWSTDTWSYHDAFGFQENFTDEMNNPDFNYSSALSNLLGNDSKSFSQSLTY